MDDHYFMCKSDGCEVSNTCARHMDSGTWPVSVDDITEQLFIFAKGGRNICGHYDHTTQLTDLCDIAAQALEQEYRNDKRLKDRLKDVL